MIDKAKVEVLVADDDGGLRALLSSVIRQCGYTNVSYATNGQEAVKVVEQKEKDIRVAFFDINMPVKSGIEALQETRKLKPGCFCVIVSGQSSMENIKAALGSGAKGFIVKPYSAQKIVDVLAKFEREATR